MVAETLGPGATVKVVPAEEADRGGPGACLIVALDGARPLAVPTVHRLPAAGDTVIGRSDGERQVRRGDGDGKAALRLRVPDGQVSARHARVKPRRDGWVIDDLGSTNGTILNGEPLTAATELEDGDVIAIGRTFVVFRRLEHDDAAAPRDADLDQLAAGLPDGLRTLSPTLAVRFAELAQVAASRTSVVILGASGSGKELAARAVHERSQRRGPLVCVNCAGLPEALVEGELFGHKKGAFSGAIADKDGLVAAASGGTLFLDEIGELRLPAQAALLRAVQEGEVMAIGATAPRKVDLRVVVATNRDLPALVAADRFRADLWARLNGFTMALPPLRERKEDLGALLRIFLPRHAGERAVPAITAAAGAALFGYDWPLNIRELEKVVERALALGGGGELDVAQLPATLVAAEAASGGADGDDALRDQLIGLLRELNGNLADVGRRMGKKRQQIQKWCKRLAIDPAQFRGRSGAR